MEDGSIFVCFLCEKEFRQVALLQEHMKEHGTLPEMSEDLPSRRNASSKDKEDKKIRTYGSSKKPKRASNFSLEQSRKTEVPILNSSIDINKIIKIKTEPCTSSESTSIKIKVTPSTKKIINSVSKPKTSQNSVVPSKIRVKPDPDDFSAAMQRAMKIKKYIERKENKAQEKEKVIPQPEPEVDEMQMQDMEFEGAQESIMMVDSNFFTSGASKTPIGPTIMNAEPDGFMVPQKISSGKQSQNTKRKRKSFMNDNFIIQERNENFIIQEMFYDGDKGEEEDDDDDDSENSESNISNHVQVFRNYGLQVNSRGRGRGRGRGKRGRPAKIKEEHMEEMPEYFKVSRPGQRSKPRINPDEEFGSTFQCLECYKEFRTVSTMRVHMKTHAEDKEIPCPYCDEVFPQRYILYEHLVNDHEESSSLTCPVCNKIFTRPDSLKSHMVRMHEENGGLNCFVCGKSFPSQGQLEIHVRVHTGERPFKCDICKKGFVQKAHLRTHLRTMHNMTEANTTPCRICLKKFDGRSALREHFNNDHGLNTAQYKNQVAKLRKEGKIPEVLPPKIRVVDPSFRYQKVSVSEVKDDAMNFPQPNVSTSSTTTTMNGTNKAEKASSVYLTRRAGRKLKIKTKSNKSSSKAPGMGTVMNLASDDVMFTPVNFNLDDDDQPKGRDQEELSIVESAFKVAEEMDHLKDGSSATILMTDGSGSSGIYYSLPIDMPEDADDEYAQFAAEHAHIGLEQDESEMDSPTGFIPNSGTTNSKGSRKGAIVKAEPLEIYTGNMETVQAIEMLTM